MRKLRSSVEGMTMVTTLMSYAMAILNTGEIHPLTTSWCCFPCQYQNPAVQHERPALFKQLGSAQFRHGGEITVLAVAPNKKLVASGGLDGIVKIWDVHTGRLLQLLSMSRTSIRAVSFSQEDRKSTRLNSSH